MAAVGQKRGIGDKKELAQGKKTALERTVEDGGEKHKMPTSTYKHTQHTHTYTHTNTHTPSCQHGDSQDTSRV